METVQSLKPLELISIHFFGPLTKSTFTKYTKLYPFRNATSETSVKKLDEFMCQVGQPEKVLPDRGTQFISKLWGQLYVIEISK